MINRDPNQLHEKVKQFIPIEGEDAMLTDTAMTEFILDNCEIFFTPESTFFCQTDLGHDNYPQYFEVLHPRFAKEFQPFATEHYQNMMQTKTLDMRFDFGHTCPNWPDIISLGFAGLKERVRSYAQAEANAAQPDPRKERFYTCVLRVYTAAERFIQRVIQKAEAEARMQIAAGLRNLLTAPPQNLFEGFQMLLLYHFLQHFAEETWIRTFGRVDSLLYPFYGSSTIEEARDMVSAFLREINDHGMSENQPFALGGTDREGRDLINELSYLFIEEYKKLKPPFVKIHVLCSDHTPEAFLRSALDGVRNGANSICFFGDAVLKRALLRLGVAQEDTIDYHVDGCYECGGYGELTSPATGRISIAKAIELTLNNGNDMLTGCRLGLPVTAIPDTFEAFYAEFLRQLQYLADSAKQYIDAMERLYPRLHAGLFYSSGFEEYVTAGKDVFVNFGAKYNNTSVCGIGLGTAVDSLMAVKKIVYEDRLMTFAELSDLMKRNWEGQEALRLTAKNKFPKYGMGDKEVDAYAVDLVEHLAAMLNAVPNAKGGVYRLGLHSITVRWTMGAALAATPDGRLAGESTSLNTGASFGADRNGVTGHILSVTSLDATYAPNSVTLDLDLHASAVKGEEGLHALYATLKTYLDRGGFSIHYNVLDTDTLRAAQEHPENYPNLQVRLCGWNARFTRLSKEMQDEYIARSE